VATKREAHRGLKLRDGSEHKWTSGGECLGGEGRQSSKSQTLGKASETVDGRGHIIKNQTGIWGKCLIYTKENVGRRKKNIKKWAIAACHTRA